jgi:hypothetical protein
MSTVIVPDVTVTPRSAWSEAMTTGIDNAPV